MSDKLKLFLLDDSTNIIAEANIKKPKSYEDLLKSIKKAFKNIYSDFILFYQSIDNKEVIINNNEKYQKIKDILLIRKNEKQINQDSIFSMNYNKLSESKQEILDEKYNCYICNSNIKNENPYFCYICQKIFHEKCLKDWEKKRKELNEILNCPYCNNLLEFEKWKKKLDFIDNRKNEAENMDKINHLEKKEKFQNNMNLINKNKINKLENDNKNILNMNAKFIEKTFNLLKNILDKFNEINSLIKNKNNNLTNIIENISKKTIKSNIDKISNIILEQFEQLITKLKIKYNNQDYFNQTFSDRFRPPPSTNKAESSNNKKKNQNQNLQKINLKKNNEINLIYTAQYECYQKIFSEKFVKNNFNNIKLCINGKDSPLVYDFKLKKGKNNVTMIIMKKLQNLEKMFYECDSLIDLDQLKFLDTSEVTNFSYMFAGIQSLTNVKPLENWDVSKGEDFSYMFSKCYQLLDMSLKALLFPQCSMDVESFMI